MATASMKQCWQTVMDGVMLLQHVCMTSTALDDVRHNAARTAAQLVPIGAMPFSAGAVMRQYHHN